MEIFISSLSPMTGPQILRCSNESDKLNWLIRFCLTDQGAPPWPEMGCLFDVKIVSVRDVNRIACIMLLRELTDVIEKQHLVPQYAVGIVFSTSDEVRLPLLLPHLRDRFCLLAKTLLKQLQETSDMTVLSDDAKESLWNSLVAVQKDAKGWLHSLVLRSDIEGMALDAFCRNGSHERVDAMLSCCLAQRCVIVRSTSVEAVQSFVATLLLFMPDEKLLLCSLKTAVVLEEIIPNLSVQGTTLPISEELFRRTIYSQFPTAVIDLDSPEGMHYIPPSMTEEPIEWTKYRVTRESVLLAGDSPARLIFRTCSRVSRLIEDAVHSLVRSRCPSLFLAQWRQKMRWLALRCVSCEVMGDRNIVPLVESLDNDILLNFANFNSGRATIRRKVNEAGTKFDDF